MTVDVGDGGVHLGLALHTLGDDLAVALVHGGVFPGLHGTFNGLGVGHVLHRLHGQHRSQLLHVEHIAYHQAVQIGLGVQGHQVAQGHVVGVGDAVEGVALHHGVGSGTVAVGPQGLLHLINGQDGVHGIHGLDFHRVQELHRGGVLRGVLVLKALEQVVQGVLVLDHAHRLAVYHHLVLAQLAAEIVQLGVKVVLDVLL